MTARKATTTPTETPETVTDTAETVTGDGTGQALPDLANTDTEHQAAGIDGATGTPIDSDLQPAADDPEGAELFGHLKALGNANPDVNVTVVQNAHGTYSWTARDAEDGRELAANGPHRAERIVADLTRLFNEDRATVALRVTGDPKTRRLA